MKFYLLSDNTDTLLGMRLTGIEGVLIHTREETERELQKALNNPEIAIILITEKLSVLVPEKIRQIKLENSLPLLAIIPDRHGGTTGDYITRCVEEAIGITL